MRKLLLLLLALSSLGQLPTAAAQARNPTVYADVPDLSMIRVGKTYYMSSTTMHMSPGVPIMKSTDLVNWHLVSYAYDTLAGNDAMRLNHGQSTYGRGSWASSLRYHRGTYYVSTFAQTTGKTHVYSTKNIEKDPWKAVAFRPSLHDHSLFFDDDGRVYMVYGSGKIQLAELAADVAGLKPGTAPQVLIENASAPTGAKEGLPAEGSQLFKINGKYYLFNIAWPRGGMRTVIVHRADKITGPYEGRVALQDLGVAQGGLIDTPAGQWYSYLFRDFVAAVLKIALDFEVYLVLGQRQALELDGPLRLGADHHEGLARRAGLHAHQAVALLQHGQAGEVAGLQVGHVEGYRAAALRPDGALREGIAGQQKRRIDAPGAQAQVAGPLGQRP